MKPAELIAALKEGMARRPEAARRDDDLVFTFVGPTARGIGVRAMVLNYCGPGSDKLMGVDRKTALRWIKKLEAV